MSTISKRTFGLAFTAAVVAAGALVAGVANAGTNPPPNTLGSCGSDDLTAVVSEGVSPTGADKPFRITFSASNSRVSCTLGGVPQNVRFRNADGVLLGIDANPLTGGEAPSPVLIDADHQAESYVSTPLPHEPGAPAASISFTMPSGGPTGTPFELVWPSAINGPADITAVFVPVS